MKPPTHITGNAGLYYVCYRLSCMGWNVMPTARNARGIDIVAYNSDGSRFVGIQVKALSKRDPVPLGASVDKIMGDFCVIVINVAQEPRTFVMLPAEVEERAQESGRAKGQVSYWLQPASYDTDEFREAWHRIGHGNDVA